MYRITTLLALFLLLFTACDPATESGTNTSGEGTDVDVVTDADNTQTQPIAAVPGDFGGEMKILDDKIKSPRKELSGTVGGVPVTINYGSPAVNDRVIYGDLVPFNKVWRTGANEATRITFAQDVIVGADAKKLKAGTYSLFTLPTSKNEWTVIFNTETEQWGAYDYDDAKDAVRATAMSKANSGKAERMDFNLAAEGIKLMWDDLVVEFPVSGTSK